MAVLSPGTVLPILVATYYHVLAINNTLFTLLSDTKRVDANLYGIKKGP